MGMVIGGSVVVVWALSYLGDYSRRVKNGQRATRFGTPLLRVISYSSCLYLYIGGGILSDLVYSLWSVKQVFFSRCRELNLLFLFFVGEGRPEDLPFVA